MKTQGSSDIEHATLRGNLSCFGWQSPTLIRVKI